MVLIDLAQNVTPWFADLLPWGDMNQGLLWHSSVDTSVLGQYIDPDVFKGARGIFNNFIKSGQAWALLIGIILGYMIRSLTSYG